MTDAANLLMILSEIKNTYPNMERLEIYNLAAMSHVKVSFEMPIYTDKADGIGVLNMLEAIRSNGLIEKTRFYQAYIRIIWESSRSSSNRKNTLLSKISLWCR